MSNRYANNKSKLRKGEYQRENNTFEYRWIDKNGKRRYIYAKSLPELRKKEETITRDTLDGIDYSRLDMTINSYFEIWKKIKTGVRVSYFTSCTRTYERYVEPQFGKTKLRNITYSGVVMFLESLVREKGLKYGTVRNIALVLSMVLEVAVKDDVLRNNPCKGALKELRRQYANDAKVVRALTLHEQKYFEAFLAKPGRFHQYCPVFTVMLWTGMRVGEVLGLRWEDIDFVNNEIDVNHIILDYSRGKGKGSVYTANPPKTRKSFRRIPMLPKVKEALIEEKCFQDLLGIKCISNIDGYTNFIFLDSKGSVLPYRKLNHVLTDISEEINKEIKENGNPDISEFPHVHNHMLRHTFATRMREAGADIKATSEMMGHDSIMITLKTYTDASRDFKSREIAVLDRYYENAE